MEKHKKIGTTLLIILFPLGILYCIIHTLGKEFSTFVGSIFLLGIGILIGIYIVEPQVILDFVDKVKIWFLTIKK